jgi:anthranilate synthase/aminodeoxychorismate synthase-like glutamine amidotransferase
MVNIAKKHCHRGDVFQLVLSRRFEQAFKGDDFNVYRALRNVNPSPYLFYFDYGNFKIFGSSPEAQLILKDKKAEIHPIAGTFPRSGDDMDDAKFAQKLINDEKENSEHVMLVDLARNDLSRHCSEVGVENYKQIQFFSHVIHLVSKVCGKIKNNISSMQIVADTFPAGTLSGAPKFKAMELIEKYEKTNRSFYGGAIGFMDFKGNYNHAIMIRTFLSCNQELHWQAGAGIVTKSSPNKLQKIFKMKKVLVVDNYDSFTYNLVHYLEDLNCKVLVKRNDQIKIETVADFDKIVLSPGPGIPEEAGLLKDIIKTYAPSKSILGVCLGMQAIGEVFGAKLFNLNNVYHGIQTEVKIISKSDDLFKNLGNKILVGRYHSWVVKIDKSSCLEVTCIDEKNEVMAIKHKNFDVKGVQFHPESVLTPKGKIILKNWVNS